jgi:amidase
MSSSELIALSAREAVAHLKKRDITPLELIDAAEERILAVDPTVNALPTLCLDMARDAAKSIPSPNAETPGWLAGLPIVVKDVTDVAGVRTTHGSPIFADHISERDDISVEILKRNGAIVIGKSNTPEFAAGANTFNEVFGKTLNPWNTSMTCGGSSGGAAVAVATGMSWLATGTDLGGSLRTPASFCSVVGLRPSPGRVAGGPQRDPFQSLSVNGPIARNVADVALMLDAEVGTDPQFPLSLEAPVRSFQEAALNPATPTRVGFSPDLGLGPVDPEVADAGGAVESASPDFSGALETFQTLRASAFVVNRAPLLEKHRDMMKPEMIWNIEKGMTQSSGDVSIALRERGALYQRVAEWFAHYDVLACPAAIVPPFDVDMRYLERVGDHEFGNYVDWLYITFAITLTGCPAISVPCGFSQSGLPVGLQLVGRPRGEAELLSFAARFEEIVNISPVAPIYPRPGSA